MKDRFIHIWIFLKSHFINRVRTKKFLVWVVITPMLLIGFLNLIGGEDEIKASVAVLDRDNSFISNTTMNILKNEERLEIYEVDQHEDGVELLRQGDVEAYLVIPNDFSEKWRRIRNNSEDYDTITFEVYHVSGDQEDLIDTVLKGVTADINELILGDEMKKPIELVNRPLQIRDREWSFSDLLLPGGIMIVILQSGFFSSSDNASALTEAMLDKRLGISPVPRIYSISGMVMMDAVFTTIAGIIALITGLILFGISLPLMNFLGMIPIIFISSLVFSYLGCCIGKFSSDRASTQGLSSMMVFPLVFFSQAYLFSMMFPDYVTAISRWLPIYPVADMMKQLLFYSPSLTYYGVKIGQSLLWLIFVFIIFLYFYRD